MTFDIGNNLFTLGIIALFRNVIVFLFAIGVLAVGGYFFYRLIAPRFPELTDRQKSFGIILLCVFLILAVIFIAG